MSCYFDELLADEFSLPASTKPTHLFLKPFADALANKDSSQVIVSSAKKIETNAVSPRPNFADPSTEQKQKLQKLLQSTQPKIEIKASANLEVTTVSVAPAFQADPNEIQGWNIEPVTALSVSEVLASPESITSPQAVIVTTTQSPQADHKLQSSQAYEMPGLAWMPNGMPAWAQSRFDVLLFKVAGLTLAVPLISLGQIQPITSELTPLFGQADWFMGIQPTPTGKIRTVNTAKFVMPERYDENFAKNAKYVVSINGVPWGLAVDSVNQPIRLSPDAVKWRTNRGQRPWLAGTIKEHMCALLDIPMIGQILMDADRNFGAARLR